MTSLIVAPLSSLLMQRRPAQPPPKAPAISTHSLLTSWPAIHLAKNILGTASRFMLAHSPLHPSICQNEIHREAADFQLKMNSVPLLLIRRPTTAFLGRASKMFIKT
jgi:hypothetical protein